MVQANELRHNSHYLLNGKIERFDNRGYVIWDLKCYEGILLTPEILEKCGFEYDQITHYKNILMLADGDNGFDVWVKHFSESNRIAKIQYLHQLQNLYFALTGEELIYTP